MAKIPGTRDERSTRFRLDAGKANFTRLNGWRLNARRLDEVQTMRKLAAEEIAEEEFTSRIRANCHQVLRKS